MASRALSGAWRGRQVVLRPSSVSGVVNDHINGAKLHVVPVDRTPVNYVNVNSGKLVNIEQHHEAATVQLSTVIDSKIDLERLELNAVLTWRDHSVAEDVAWTARKQLRVTGAAHGLHVTVRAASTKSKD